MTQAHSVTNLSLYAFVLDPNGHNIEAVCRAPD